MLSHDAGAFAREKGNGRKWLIGDYEAGDAVFHDNCPLMSACRCKHAADELQS